MHVGWAPYPSLLFLWNKGSFLDPILQILKITFTKFLLRQNIHVIVNAIKQTTFLGLLLVMQAKPKSRNL